MNTFNGRGHPQRKTLHGTESRVLVVGALEVQAGDFLLRSPRVAKEVEDVLDYTEKHGKVFINFYGSNTDYEVEPDQKFTVFRPVKG